MPSMNVGGMRALPPRLFGQGAGAINFCRMLGGAFGTNLLAVLLERRTQLHSETMNSLLDGGHYTLEARRLLEQAYLNGGLSLWDARDSAHAFLSRMVASQAELQGFRDAFIAVALACLVAMLPGLTLRQKPPAAAGRPNPPGAAK